MKRQVFALLSVLFLISILQLPMIPEVKAQSFPIGLTLEYQMTYEEDDVITMEKTFEYEVLEWATSAGEDVVKVNKSITYNEVTTDETLFIEIPTWEIVTETGGHTGSYMTSPLWWDISAWEDGENEYIPASSAAKEYDLAADHSIESDDVTYTCWRASYSTSAAGWTNFKHLYYENALGVLVEEYQRMYHYQYDIDRVEIHLLVESNIDTFLGGLALGLPMEVILGVAGVGIVLVVLVMVRRR